MAAGGEEGSDLGQDEILDVKERIRIVVNEYAELNEQIGRLKDEIGVYDGEIASREAEEGEVTRKLEGLEDEAKSGGDGEGMRSGDEKDELMKEKDGLKAEQYTLLQEILRLGKEIIRLGKEIRRLEDKKNSLVKKKDRLREEQKRLVEDFHKKEMAAVKAEVSSRSNSARSAFVKQNMKEVDVEVVLRDLPSLDDVESVAGKLRLAEVSIREDATELRDVHPAIHEVLNQISHAIPERTVSVLHEAGHKDLDDPIKGSPNRIDFSIVRDGQQVSTPQTRLSGLVPKSKKRAGHSAEALKKEGESDAAKYGLERINMLKHLIARKVEDGDTSMTSWTYPLELFTIIMASNASEIIFLRTSAFVVMDGRNVRFHTNGFPRIEASPWMPFLKEGSDGEGVGGVTAGVKHLIRVLRASPEQLGDIMPVKTGSKVNVKWEGSVEEEEVEFGPFVAQGGFSEVYRCASRPDAVIKVPLTTSDIEGLAAESEILKTLNAHDDTPEIPRLLSFVGNALVMTPRGDFDLSQVAAMLHNSKQWSRLRELAYNATNAVLKALRHAHDRSLLHGDIRPRNIITLAAGDVEGGGGEGGEGGGRTKKEHRFVLIDWGLSCTKGDSRSGLHGVAAYVHDEILQSEARRSVAYEASSKHDICSVGYTLATLLWGRAGSRIRPPWKGYDISDRKAFFSDLPERKESETDGPPIHACDITVVQNLINSSEPHSYSVRMAEVGIPSA